MLEIIGLAFLVLVILFWAPYAQRTTKSGAPFIPLEPEVIEEVMKLAEIKKDDVFYDLGSGDGRVVIAAALRGAKEAYGIEIDFLRVWYSRLWLKALRLKNAQIIKGDFRHVDLSRATVVNMFLLQSTNEELKNKLQKELRKGTRVISEAFTLPGWKLVKVSPNGPIYGPIYLYVV